MKKLIFVLILSSVSFINAAGTLTWATGASGVDNTGAAIPVGWYTALIWDVGQTGIDVKNATIVATTGDDVLLDVSSTVAGRVNVSRASVTWGATYENNNIPAPWTKTPTMPALAGVDPNNDYYIVVFNNADFTKATQYAMKFINDKASPIGGNNNLSITGTAFAKTDWAPVPEPATFALMGIGLAVLGLRRRFMKK